MRIVFFLRCGLFVLLLGIHSLFAQYTVPNLGDDFYVVDRPQYINTYENDERYSEGYVWTLAPPLECRNMAQFIHVIRL